ncbi:hypothetical protein B7494_g598 [Chlorociboria aeruginascens]|nr:hypothetical protein B7494_g598 [Chlorociboria aeruginascens]
MMIVRDILRQCPTALADVWDNRISLRTVILPTSSTTFSLLFSTTGRRPPHLGFQPSPPHKIRRSKISSSQSDLRTSLSSLSQFIPFFVLISNSNIGNDATALWRHYDDSVTHEFITKQQALHVSVLSICNCTGRILSGFGSDLISKTLRASRLWCLVLASLIFLLAQLLALSIQNPHFLFFCSSLTGLAYGFLFGCFPSLVVEAFGIHGLSTNWGFMTFAPVVSGNVFNIWYGVVYDRNSVENGDGRVCTEGADCYRRINLLRKEIVE